MLFKVDLFTAILLIFLFQVLVPLLSNKHNHQAWPEVVSQDVMKHVYNLKNNVYVISGQVKGKTVLPLPVGAETISHKPDDRQVLHNVESIIIDWTHQITKVLKQCSSQLLQEGKSPGPLVEIEFWKQRVDNLENIFDQVRFWYNLIITFLFISFFIQTI